MILPLTMSRPSSHIARKGDLMRFDNSRILHGRTGIDAREGPRCLQRSHIEVD